MWEVKVAGDSKTTILEKDGLPIARFYADRFNEKMLKEIEEKLNRE